MSCTQARLGTLVVGLFLSGASPSAFALFMFVDTGVGISSNLSQTGTATSKESTTQLGTNEFAIARVDASTGSAGVAVQTPISEFAGATARLDDSWGCNCANLPIGPGTITLGIGLEGSFSADLPANELGGELDVGPYTFMFVWDGSSLGGTECYPVALGLTTCDPRTIPTALQPDGTLLFSTAWRTTIVMGTLDVIVPTSLQIGGGGDPTGQPISIDALNTFRFDILSDNPDIVWTSDSGRTSVSIAPPTTVPEPATLALFGAALASLGLRRRRKRAS